MQRLFYQGGAVGSEMSAILLAGAVTGFVSVFSAVSFAALIAAGPLTPFVPETLSITLIATMIVGVAVSSLSSYPGAIAIPQGRIAAILALLAATVVELLGPEVDPRTKFLTVVAAIVISTFFTAMVFLVLGAFRVGSLIRFIPYPVVGGFVAGTGWLLAKGSFHVMLAGLAPDSGVWSSDAVLVWGPGIVIAAALLLLNRHGEHFLSLPATLAVATTTFFVTLYISGYDVDFAIIKGWTLGPFSQRPSLGLLGWEALQAAHWHALIAQPASFATIALVSVMSLLLNATALEITTGRDIHLNHDLRVTGVANLLSCLAGGMVSFLSLSTSTIALKMGTASRTVGVVAALLCGATLLVGMPLVGFFPRAVLGGLLLYLGLSFLFEWVYTGFHRLTRGDYFVVLLILVTVASFGFIEGVAVGLLSAVCLFVVKYSRLQVVRQQTNIVDRQSNVDRPPRHQRALKAAGERTSILRLQGFLFFGTADRLFLDLRRQCEAGTQGQAPFEMLVLDFERVSGMDSSAALSFAKISQLGIRYGFVLVLSGVSGSLERQLQLEVFDLFGAPNVRRFPDLDHAVEWCEEQFLQDQTLLQPAGGLMTLQQQLADVAGGMIDAGRLMKYLNRQEVSAGVEFINEGEEACDMYFIESGTVTIDLLLDNGERLRIRKMGAGTVTGELGLYLGGKRNASVSADTDAIVYRLSRAGLEIMEEHEPDLAAAFHQYMARLLSERLVHTNRALRGLLE